MSARFVPLLVLLGMGIIWGLQFAMLKLAVQSGYPELQVAFFALALIAIIYAIMVALRRAFFAITRERLIFFTIVATIGYLLPMGATLYAAPYVPAGILVLMASLAPMFTFATALGLRTEHVSRARLGAMLLGTVSVLMVLLPEAELPDHGVLGWMLLALVVPICYGVEPIYVAARWPEGLDVMQVGLGEALGAAILMVPILLVFGEPSSINIQWSIAELAIAVFVISGVIEVFMYFYLVRTTGGVLVNFGAFIALFAGIGWGMLIFSETHRVNVWLAVVVLVGALGLVCYDSIRQQSG